MSSEIEYLENPNFKISKKGYDKSEVKKFLHNISISIEDKLNEIKNLENDIVGYKQKVDEFDDIEKELRDTIVSLKVANNDILLEAQEKVSSMMIDAEEKSKQIIIKAEEEAKSTRDTLLFLKEQQEILITRLKIIINNQDGMMKDLAKGDPSAKLQKTMAEASAFNAQSEMNIEAILEKLL